MRVWWLEGRGAGGSWSARTMMVTHHTLRNDELDIWEEGLINQKQQKTNLGSAG
jgi:hypothetical protein